ncbi:hypothetical protein DICVIV_08622 [Dictyocaulus viviparus]|uniref:Uncharacterized protein n=1 Tax=Dictyocaulus viviparus TaxID=29172 RepID=A0A0D8XSK0_DICVI|nr:hypothetical protein DICVIV_08622 [Dictyocaulus viviparus]
MRWSMLTNSTMRTKIIAVRIRVPILAFLVYQRSSRYGSPDINVTNLVNQLFTANVYKHYCFILACSLLSSGSTTLFSAY